MKLKTFTLITLLIIVNSCATRSNSGVSSNAEQLITQHQKIAVLPPIIEYGKKGKLSPKEMEKASEEDKTLMQMEMISWITKRLNKSKSNISVQDANSTKAKLNKAGITNIANISSNELAEILGVDAVLRSNFSLEQPFTLAEAIITERLIGLPSATSKAQGALSLYDLNSDSSIWSYSTKTDNSWGVVKARTPQDLIGLIMKRASKTLPY